MVAVGPLLLLSCHAGAGASVGQGFGDPWRVTGKGVRGWGWGLQSWNPRTLQLPASTPVPAVQRCLVSDLQV